MIKSQKDLSNRSPLDGGERQKNDHVVQHVMQHARQRRAGLAAHVPFVYGQREKTENGRRVRRRMRRGENDAQKPHGSVRSQPRLLQAAIAKSPEQEIF